MENIYKVLDDLDIKYVKHEHPPVFTTEEAKKYWGDIDAGHVKNLFLRNAKGNTHYLVIVRDVKRVDLKSLQAKLGESRLGFGSPERLLKYLGVTPGSVSALGLVNDKEHEVIVVLDKELLETETKLGFHPNINTQTLEIKIEDLRRFLDWCGNEVREIDL